MTTRLRLLPLLASFALVLGACGGSGGNNKSDETEAPDTETTEDGSETTDSTEAEEPTETTEDEGDPADGDEAALAEEFAAAFTEAAGFSLPQDEIECAVAGMLEELSFAELQALSELAPGEFPDDATIETLAQVFDACVSAETVASLLEEQLATTLEPEQAACVANAFAEQYGFGDLLRIGVSQDTAALEEAMTDIMAACV
jgi:hypothetical protein